MGEPILAQAMPHVMKDPAATTKSSGFPEEGLLDFVEENIAAFAALRRVLLEEREDILQSDALRLEQHNRAKEEVISKIRCLDERRSVLWQEIGVCIQQDPSSLTLSDLLEVEPLAHSGAFRASLHSLSDLLSDVRRINIGNRDLVLGALNLIKGSVSLLTGLFHGQGVYQRTGEIGIGNQGGKLLSGAA